ncbi:MAG: DMT family transporter [Deltaproteobacteria bacterium]|nr:DMT family transporter [Deltaproteobacteria bacterium]
MIIYIKLVLTAFFWGGTFIAGKVLAQNVGPFSASFLRFLTASFCLILITWKVEGSFPVIHRKQIFPVILLGLSGVFSYNVFFFKGLRLIEAGRASIIIANNPIFITLLSWLIFREKLTLVKFVGVLISVTGAVIVISRGNLNGIMTAGLGFGEFFIFCCVASWVCYSLIGKAVMNDLSPLASVTYSAIIGTACLCIPALLEGMLSDMSHYMVSEWISIFYLGFFGTVLGFVWYYEGIKRIGPSRASLFINFVPIFAIILAFLILKEPITLSLFIGTIFVCMGVYLTNRP